MTQEEILQEIQHCKNSPYYFATKYLTVVNHKGEVIKFQTPLDETSFNKMVEKYETSRPNN